MEQVYGAHDTWDLHWILKGNSKARLLSSDPVHRVTLLPGGHTQVTYFHFKFSVGPGDFSIGMKMNLQVLP